MSDETAVAQTETPGQPELAEIATVRKDLDYLAGWLAALPNPDAILKEQPQRGIRIYKDMQRDGHVRSVCQTRTLAVLGKDWEVLPASADAADGRVRDLVATALEGIKGFERARGALLGGVWTGFAVGEVLWALRQAQGRRCIVPTEIRARGAHRFTFDLDGRPRLLTLANMLDGEALPDRKFLVFQYDATPENPYGVALGQSCYWPWWFKKVGIKFWLAFADRFGTPFPLGKFPAGTTKEDQDKLLALMQAFTQESAGIVPEGVTVELLEAKRSAGADVYAPLASFMNAEISKAVLGQTATTEGTPGALGSEQARSEVRADLVLADADLLDEVLTSQLIRWIVDFNFGPDVPVPWFHTKTEGELGLTDQVQQAQRDQTLQGMGLAIPERYAQETYGIPAAAEGEAVLVRPVGQFGPVGQVGPGGFSEPGVMLDRIVAEAEARLRAQGTRQGGRG
jgi:phage gp29-like protein